MAKSPDDYMRELDEQLRSIPGRTDGLRAVFQFELDGENGGSWWIEAEDGTGAVHSGASKQPNVTVRMTDDVFVRVGAKELDGTEAYMDGLMVVEGDQSKAMWLAQIFGD